MARNLALIGPASVGKTSLIDLILFKAGEATRAGSVDDKSSLSDFEPEEKERHHSLASSILHASWKKELINVLDTPGYPDFACEAYMCLAAVETAVFVISAGGPVSFHARKLWERCGEEGVARLIFLNKMDSENASFDESIAAIQEAFGDRCVPIVLPEGAAASFSGVVSVLADGSGEAAATVKETLVERTVEADDALMERYLEGQEISDEEFRGAFGKAVAQGNVVPVLCGSVTGDIGVEQLLDAIVEIAPVHDAGSPRQVLQGAEGEDTATLTCNEGSPFSAFVFKTLSDPYVGKLSFFRVFSGSVGTDDMVLDVRIGKPQKVSNLLRMQGKEQVHIDRAVAGDIVAASKIEDFELGDSLCDPNTIVRFQPVDLPKPMATLAAEPKSRGDEQKIGTALTKISSEDPGFMSHRDPNTGEMLINGMSSMHLDVVMERMKRRFGVEITTRMPKIPYKETITTAAEAHHRHKKQSGGRGQFGEVYIRLLPRERGAGYEFVDKIVGGSVPRQYIPAVDKGIHERMTEGPLAGCEVVDCAVELYDGKYHDVDSDELSFKLAAGRAFLEGFEKGRPVLLEPVMDLEIAVPSRFMGDISGDLNSRRGRIQGMDTVGDMQMIKAQVPLASVVNYSTELRSITHGEGDFSMEFSHYDIVPPQEQQKIVAAYKASKEEEAH